MADDHSDPTWNGAAILDVNRLLRWLAKVDDVTGTLASAQAYHMQHYVSQIDDNSTEHTTWRADVRRGLVLCITGDEKPAYASNAQQHKHNLGTRVGSTQRGGLWRAFLSMHVFRLPGEIADSR